MTEEKRTTEKKAAAKEAAKAESAAPAQEAAAEQPEEQAAEAAAEQPAAVRAVVVTEFRDKRSRRARRRPGDALEVSPERFAELLAAGERLGYELVKEAE